MDELSRAACPTLRDGDAFILIFVFGVLKKSETPSLMEYVSVMIC